MSNPSAFVSLDKYTKDLTQERAMMFYARKKFERIDLYVKESIVQLKYLRSFLHPCDFSLLEVVDGVLERLDCLLKSERPDIAASSPSPSLDSVKFSSVSDGVQFHLEFEGER